MKEYKENSLSTIKTSQILQQSDFDVLRDLRDELENVFYYSQLFRTRTEMEASVLEDVRFPTPDSKYWQAMREQNVMFQELVYLSYEYRKNTVEIKKLERDMENESDPLEREMLLIEIEKKRFARLNQERTAKDRIREIREWHEIKQELIPQMRCSLTDCNEHQLVSYAKRWIQQFMVVVNGGANSSPSEMNNLYAQLDKGLKLCRERGLLDKVLAGVPGEVITMLQGVNPQWQLPQNTSPLRLAE